MLSEAHGILFAVRRPLPSLPFAALLAGLIGAGCQRVETDYNPHTDFSKFKTFAWEGSQKIVENEMERDYPKLMEDFRATISAAMESKGLHQADADTADLLLSAHLELSPYSTGPGSEGSGKGADAPAHELGPLVLAPYSVTQVENSNLDRQLEEGTLLLNMTNPTSGAPLWQGWIRRVVDVANLRDVEWRRDASAGDVNYRHRMVVQAVARLLSGFPPKTVARRAHEAEKP